MKMSRLLASGLVMTWLAAMAVHPPTDAADDPPADKPMDTQSPIDTQLAETPNGLIRQLGDASFERREQAERELVELGGSMRPALKSALDSTDAEVQRRARRVLGRLLDDDYGRRLKAFIQDEQGVESHDLPGWRRFREMVGESAGARKLFVQMQQEEAALLESAEAGADPAAEVLQWRLRQFVSTRGRKGKKLPLGTIASVLLVSGDVELELPASILNSRELMLLVQDQAFRSALQDAKTPTPFRTLVGRWLLRPTGTQLLHVKLRMALQYKLMEGFELGVRALAQKELPGNYRYFGIPIIAQLGGKKHAARLVDLLDDETEVGRRPVRVNGKIVVNAIQVRDVALGWLIHVTGQDLADYHLAHVKSSFAALAKNKNATPSITSVYFQKKEDRDAALIKWKAWYADHPLPDPPELPPSASEPALASGSLVPNQGGVVEIPGKDPKNALPALGGLTVADRLVARKLVQARRRMDEGEFGEAALLLGSVLADEHDYTYLPERLVSLRRGLKSEAERLLGTMPAKGRQAYELQCGTDARNKLDEAIRQGDATAMAAVVRGYFHTQAGREATYLLASYHYDRAEPLRAAMLLDRLRRDGMQTGGYEPDLSLKLAACWLLAELPGRAETVLWRVRAEYSNTPPRRGDRLLSWFEQDDGALDWLRELLEIEADGLEFLWPLPGGNLARNRTSSELQPYLRSIPPLTPAGHDDIRQAMATLTDQKLKRYEAQIPSCKPLVVGQVVVTRTATQLCAIDRTNGRLLWRSPLNDSINHLLATKSLDDSHRGAFLNTGLERRMWDNPTYGTLSSTAHHVFAIEGLGFGKRGEHQRLVVMPDGRRRLDADGMKSYNTLAAYSIETGKLAWEVGGPLIRSARPLAGTFFLGPPLPIGDRLFVIGKRGRQNHLFELDADTGQRVWELVLDDAPPPPIRTSINVLASDPDNQPSLRAGLSPSFQDGVLVCPTDAGAYVGIDLSNRAIRWVFESPKVLRSSAAWGAVNPFMRQLRTSARAVSGHRWSDCRIVIAEGRVLFTPPLADRLYCLDLESGRVAWSVSRRDGLYLAGVTDEGIVVIAGRANVWGLRLADGASAWKSPAVGLPPGALPSGNGYLTEDRFHLPLTTREVAVFDVRHGALVSRTRASDGFLPGNLVPCDDGVLSQNAQGLWQLETLEQRSLQLADRLAQDPMDAETLALRGELSLNRGRIDEAIVDLKQSMRLAPTDATRKLLLDASMEAVRRNLAGRPELVNEMKGLLRSEDERLQYHRLLARALRENGDFDAAVEHYLRLVALIDDPGELEFVAAGHQVRKDRWLRAELDDLTSEATADQLALLRKRVLAMRADVADQRLVRFFGDVAVADILRLEISRHDLAEGRMVQAELRLRHVLAHGDERARNEATARLAQLLRQANRPFEAVRFYTVLASELRDVVVQDGVTGDVTGGQLVDQLPENDPVRGLLAGNPVWPRGKAETHEDAKPNRVAYGFPIALHAAQPMTPRLQVTITSGSAAELIADNPWASNRLRIKLPATGQRSAANLVSLSQGALRGHLFIGWTGDRIVAADLLAKEGKLLWQRPIQMGTQASQQMRMVAMRLGIQAAGRKFPGHGAQPVAIGADCVCFIENDWLVAVDLIDGSELWKREGFSDGADLVTDDRRLFVTPAGRTEARVLRLSDGSDVAVCDMPPLDQRLICLGDQVVTWAVEKEKAHLRLLDLTNGQTTWQYTFDPKAKPAVVALGDELIVVEPDGQIVLIDTRSGTRRWEQKNAKLAACTDLFVVRSDARYLLFNHSIAARAKQAGIVINRLRVGPGSVNVSGHVVAVERASGNQIWTQPLEGQSLALNYPSEVPVLAFLSRLRVVENKRASYQSEIRCLDQRTGLLLHKSTDKTSNHLFEITARPNEGVVEIRTIRKTVRFTFHDKADSDKE